MDSGELQNTLKRLCKVMWDANVTNPITYVTQISYLLFLKMLEEMDTEQKENGNGNYKTMFTKFKIGSREVNFEPLRWSALTSNPDNERMLRTSGFTDWRVTVPHSADPVSLALNIVMIFPIYWPNGRKGRPRKDVHGWFLRNVSRKGTST